MSSTRRTTTTSSDDVPTVFRQDYPEAVVGEWAVFWEVNDESAFLAAEGRPDDPTDVTDEAWFAISESAVVDMDDWQ
jgi:hypothetical protein